MLSSLSVIALCALSVVAQDAPKFSPSEVQGHFVEQFVVDSSRWSSSKATKESDAGEVFSYVGEWSVEEPTVFPGIAGDRGLVMKSKAAHHAISVPFSTPLESKDDQPLVVQYEVKLQKGLECGGAYIKLLTDSSVGIQAEEFSDKTPYTIMFGPDRCGSTSKVHFIFRHMNPITKEVEEKHLIAPPAPRITKVSTLYTLIVRPDQTFEIKINGESQKTGSLLEDFLPAVNPSAEIDDITDVKPADWVESPKIADVDAVKPADWDEDAPQYILDASAEIPADWLVDEAANIPDPDAQQPEEWSTEDDGDWDAPTIPNPKCAEAAGCGAWIRPEMANPVYKGKWFAPLIDNPDYKGVWAPAKISNPDYFQDLTPSNFGKMAGVGIELWSMTEDILFDNIYIGHSELDAASFADETFSIKKPLEDELEAAAVPEVPETSASANKGEEPEWREDFVKWAQWKIEEFADIAVLDPVKAIQELPYTGAAAATVIATLLGLASFFFSFLIPSSKPVKKVVVPASKKTDAVTADSKKAAAEDDDEDAEEIIVAKASAAKEGVKTRKAKAAQ